MFLSINIIGYINRASHKDEKDTKFRLIDWLIVALLNSGCVERLFCTLELLKKSKSNTNEKEARNAQNVFRFGTIASIHARVTEITLAGVAGHDVLAVAHHALVVVLPDDLEVTVAGHYRTGFIWNSEKRTIDYITAYSDQSALRPWLSYSSFHVENFIPISILFPIPIGNTNPKSYFYLNSIGKYQLQFPMPISLPIIT